MTELNVSELGFSNEKALYLEDVLNHIIDHSFRHPDQIIRSDDKKINKIIYTSKEQNSRNNYLVFQYLDTELSTIYAIYNEDGISETQLCYRLDQVIEILNERKI